MLFQDVIDGTAFGPAKDRFENSQYSLDFLTREIEQAHKYVLEDAALRLSVNVSITKPSSILESFKFFRLPFDKIWIEFSNEVASDFLRLLGNDNKKFESSMPLVKTGYLLEQDSAHSISMRAVGVYRLPDGTTVADPFVSLCIFDTTPESEANRPVDRDLYDISPDVTGKMRDFYSRLNKDVKERSALGSLTERFKGSLDYIHIPQISAMKIDESRFAERVEQNVSVMFNLFKVVVLPSLILLNCRNAVETEAKEPSPRLNKARTKKKKPLLQPYRTVSVFLRPLQKDRSSSSSSSGGAKYDAQLASFVTGHFKVRKTGIFWWSPHVRNSQNSLNDIETVRVLKR